MYSLQQSVRSKKWNKSLFQGDRRPKKLKYSCRVLNPALRSNRECDYIKQGNKSYTIVSNILPNTQIYRSKEKKNKKGK